MDEEFEVLSSDEVLHVRSGRVLLANPTFKVSELLDALAQLISEQEDEWSEAQEGWFSDRGLSCEVLRLGNSGWQRGKVRVRLEFAPERPKLLGESRLKRDTLPERAEDSYSRPVDSRPVERPEDSYSRSGNRIEDPYAPLDPPDDPYVRPAERPNNPYGRPEIFLRPTREDVYNRDKTDDWGDDDDLYPKDRGY
jgi:hypothetical protein